MATATVKLVPVTLDRVRHLRLDFNAFATAEEITGKNYMAKGAWSEPSARDLRALLFACLKHEDAKLTLEDVGALLHAGNVAEIAAALTQVVSGALPESDDGEQEDAKEPGKAPAVSIT